MVGLETPSQSLTFALRAIARRAGLEIDHDDLNAVLGLSWMVCAVPREADVGRWAMYARDAFLVEAGRLFGLHIRDIHPPDAARGLDRAAEFDQHFDASYRPLILRALENDQPVLAWQGWEGGRGLAWGWIREACDDGVGFRGAVVESNEALSSCDVATLVRPPIQLYVVERVTACHPEPGELMGMALDHARRVLADEWHKRFGVVTGPSAYEEWLQVAGASGSGRQAAAILAGHESAIRFLERPRRGLSAGFPRIARQLVEESFAVVQSMRELLVSDPEQPPGAAFTEQVSQARSATVRMQALVGSVRTF